MAEEVKTPTEDYLSYLRGGKEVDVKLVAKDDPETLSRVVVYSLQNNTYHRQKLCKALVSLINHAPSTYRDITWEIIQEVPLSHLLHVIDVIDKKENTRRLRMPIAVKVANSSEHEIIRSYFIATSKFRKLFSYMYLPREKVDDRDIENPNYRLANKLASIPTNKIMDELGISPTDLVRRYKVPLHMVMQWVESPEQAFDLAEASTSDDYLRHARWFRTIMGDDDYEKVTIDKVDSVKDPLSFLSIKDHLESSGALTPNLTEKLNTRAEHVIDQIVSQSNLDKIALVTDVSASMQQAITITSKLHEAFSMMGSITDMVAFREYAFQTTHKQLTQLKPDGMTSIGSALVLLSQKLQENPQAIIIVTDLEENTRPLLRDTVNLLEDFGKPPLIILQCGGRGKIDVDYPHSVIPVKEFHPRLLKDIIANITKLTSKTVEEKKITETVKERKPLDEELGAINLPQRRDESLKSGYLRKVLC